MELLKATKRTETGSNKVRRLRKGGQVPAIIYGHGEVPETVSLGVRELVQALGKHERLLEISVEGKSQHVLVKEVQYDTFARDLLHIDLARVSLDERVKVTVPIVTRGTPVGAAEEGVLHQVASDVTIECLVTAIPEEIRLNVAEMKVGDSKHLRDLPLPEGAKLVGDPEQIVCSVIIIAEEEVAAPAEEGAALEPEVIGAKKEDEEAAEGEEADKKAAKPKAEKGEKGEKAE